jgi:hypothetical protein
MEVTTYPFFLSNAKDLSFVGLLRKALTAKPETLHRH